LRSNLTLNELVQVYQESDLVAFVSTYEGFGMPIIEANATGRAVVSSNTTSMPEVAGNAACLVDPFDAQSIRTGIERVIHDTAYRNALIENGYRNAARFTSEVIGQAYLDIYEEMARS
jgi:glycosyltransferase involved in cell wall biosynthesis